MAERRRRPRHRPRLAPPRAAAPQNRSASFASFATFHRQFRGPLDRLAARIERPAPLIADRATALRAAAWRAAFWIWLILAFLSGLPAAAPIVFAMLGLFAAAAAAFADIAALRRLSVRGLRGAAGAPAPPALRWTAATAAIGHGVLATAATLINAAPTLIWTLGGYAW